MAASFFIVWPEKRSVSPEWIDQRFQDAWDNEDIRPEDVDDDKIGTTEGRARALHDAGLITLSDRS